MKINIGDTWKDVVAVKINIGDVWKDVTAIKQNIGDVWKDTQIAPTTTTTTTAGPIEDYDGNEYFETVIGTQTWLYPGMIAEHTRDGTVVSFKYANNSSANAAYGLMYTYATASGTADNVNICPEGYHVATQAEITTLENYLVSNAAGKLKDDGTTYWSVSTTTGSDAYDFSMKGHGIYTSSAIQFRGTSHNWTSDTSGDPSRNAYYTQGDIQYFVRATHLTSWYCGLRVLKD